jgi:hypothetical protein
MMKTCILISTCEKYRWVAEFTRNWIDRCWKSHPPVFFCGSRGNENDSWLPLIEDQRDWMGILYHATLELLSRGNTHTYLILDDHPPLWKCHEKHLNQTIPGLMEQLEAIYIGLNGWGQGRSPSGVVLDRSWYRIENVSTDYLWKFQLHPALWDLAFLNQLLKIMIKNLPMELHTPWAFERRTGAVDARIPEEWKKRSFRVYGQLMTGSPGRNRFLSGVIWTIKVIRFFSGRLLGQKAWNKVEEKLGFLSQYYEGPYPLMWSGILKKGELNTAMLHYLKLNRKKLFLKELTEAASGNLSLASN